MQPDRFRELAEIYGQLAPLVDVCLNPPQTADVWVRWGEQRWQEKVQLQLSLKQLKGQPGCHSQLSFYFIAFRSHCKTQNWTGLTISSLFLV